MNAPSEHGSGVVVPDIAVRLKVKHEKIKWESVEIRCKRRMDRDLNMYKNQ
jgi:hypothetical protein